MAVCCSSASFVSLEQSRIFDRDQRLVAEGFGLRDFSSSEHIGSFSDQREQADALSLAKKRQVEVPNSRRTFYAIFSSCSGRSISDQSGRCSIFLSTIAREGKLALGSIGKTVGPSSSNGPSGEATAACE